MTNIDTDQRGVDQNRQGQERLIKIDMGERETHQKKTMDREGPTRLEIEQQGADQSKKLGREGSVQRIHLAVMGQPKKTCGGEEISGKDRERKGANQRNMGQKGQTTEGTE